MAKPITTIRKAEPTPEEWQKARLEEVLQEVSENAEGLLETVKLLQELHEAGILPAIHSLVKAKEDIAKIALGQLLRPPVTNAINSAMGVMEALTEIDPDTSKKMVHSLANGVKKAQEGLEANQTVSLFDLMKVLKDPDINRAIGFGLNFLKGMGEGLKEEK
ncbi:DUF1641 domain-containing protein [Brevibacillus fluminis]|uniref:DUF1641 domain-containing protein n=1 Tax=Brevibacillus fluminis TaxID=511487 RepID=A0A3M8D981_9BACL|nr:DUF1641 domain-containing protein [Brevibacillus fluminis]RNB84576.1 DUF1641 domain-containing protein [Brevibacillus fluminis]